LNIRDKFLEVEDSSEYLRASETTLFFFALVVAALSPSRLFEESILPKQLKMKKKRAVALLDCLCDRIQVVNILDAAVHAVTHKTFDLVGLRFCKVKEVHDLITSQDFRVTVPQTLTPRKPERFAVE
jgi:hypothetical protein